MIKGFLSYFTFRRTCIFVFWLAFALGIIDVFRGDHLSADANFLWAAVSVLFMRVDRLEDD